MLIIIEISWHSNFKLLRNKDKKLKVMHEKTNSMTPWSFVFFSIQHVADEFFFLFFFVARQLDHSCYWVVVCLWISKRLNSWMLLVKLRWNIPIENGLFLHHVEIIMVKMANSCSPKLSFIFDSDSMLKLSGHPPWTWSFGLCPKSRAKDLSFYFFLLEQFQAAESKKMFCLELSNFLMSSHKV